MFQSPENNSDMFCEKYIYFEKNHDIRFFRKTSLPLMEVEINVYIINIQFHPSALVHLNIVSCSKDRNDIFFDPRSDTHVQYEFLNE